MPLPTLAKTWQFQVNQTVAAQGSATATAKRLLRTIKNLLKGFGTLPWTVRGSSNGTTAAMDSSDRWTADSDLVGDTPGNAHSWIVLRQTGIATNFELCIDISNTTILPTFVISPAAGFTGGTITARPTATDEVVLQTDYLWYSTVDAQHQIHAWQSTDGQCTRVMVWRAGTNLCTFWLFDKAKNPVSGWTNPCVAWVLGGAGIAATYAALSTVSSSSAGKGRVSAAMSLFMTGEATDQTAGLLTRHATLGTVPNDLIGEWPLFPIGIASITASHVGRHGQHFDLWWRPTGVNDADTFPNNASARQFVAMGNLVLPWVGDATVPLLT